MLLLTLKSGRCDDAFSGRSIGEIFNISIAFDRWVTIGRTILRFFLLDNRINVIPICESEKYFFRWFSEFFLESNLDLIAVNAEFSAKFHSFSLRHIEATSFLAKCEWISPSNSICRWRYNSNRFNLLSSLKNEFENWKWYP